MTDSKTQVIVSTTVNAPVEKVWAAWSEPQHITQWCFASDDWHSPKAENDLRKGGNFSTRMEAKDGSFGFDFGGIYDDVVINEVIDYTMGDGRRVWVKFAGEGNTTHITERFEAESENPIEMQQAGWQMILDNFKKYAESL